MKKITSLFAVLAMLATAFVMPVSAETTGYAGGDGTEGNPYQIATKDQLAHMAEEINAGTNNNAYFVLTADIDYESAEWTPIGASENVFQGNFDGQGHVVKNLKITESCAFVGFFGYINTGGVVKNLGIDNMNINLSTGDNPDTVGGFASYVQGATITNCYLKNSIVRSGGKQASNGIGVFAGLVRNSSMIKNCYAYKIDTLAHINNVNAGFAHQRLGGGSTFENCYVAEVNAMWSRPAYSFGSDNQSNVTPVNCWSTLEAITGGNYSADRAFGNYVADKDMLVSKFEGVEGFAVSPAVNGGYPCFANEVPFKVTSVGGDGTVKIARKAGVTTPATVYVATYDAYDRFIDVATATVNADDFTFTPDGLTTGAKIKAFVWDANCNPLTYVD